MGWSVRFIYLFLALVASSVAFGQSDAGAFKNTKIQTDSIKSFSGLGAPGFPFGLTPAPISSTTRDGLTAATGQIINNSTTGTIQRYNGATWDDVVGIPSGGSTGQVLSKSSNTNYAVGWTTVTPSLTQSVETFTLSGTDISNAYVTLAHTPATAAKVSAFVRGNTAGVYGVDFTMATATHLSWNTLGFNYVVSSDVLVADYWY